MSNPEYQRLTRSRTRSSFAVISAQRSSLWLAKDHLLGVDSSGYTETYKRFYFRDIQSFQVRQTDHWKFYGLINGFLALLFAAIAFAPQDRIALFVFGPIALFFLALFVMNLVRGPTCVTQLHTAVQAERLPSLNRWKKTNQVLERVRPLIIAAQGQLAPEEIPARLEAFHAAKAQPAVAPAVIVDDPNAPPRIT